MNALTLTALWETKKYIIFIFLKNYIAFLAGWVESCVHQATKIPLTSFNKNLHNWNFLWTWKRLKTRSGLTAAWEAHSWVENRRTLESVTVDSSPLRLSARLPPSQWSISPLFHTPPVSDRPPSILRLPSDTHLPPLNDGLTCHSLTPSPPPRSFPLVPPPPLNRGPFVSHLKAKLFSPIPAAQNKASSYFESHLNQSEHTSTPPPDSSFPPRDFTGVYDSCEPVGTWQSRSLFLEASQSIKTPAI